VRKVNDLCEKQEIAPSEVIRFPPDVTVAEQAGRPLDAARTNGVHAILVHASDARLLCWAKSHADCGENVEGSTRVRGQSRQLKCRPVSRTPLIVFACLIVPTSSYHRQLFRLNFSEIFLQVCILCSAVLAEMDFRMAVWTYGPHPTRMSGPPSETERVWCGSKYGVPFFRENGAGCTHNSQTPYERAKTYLRTALLRSYTILFASVLSATTAALAANTAAIRNSSSGEVAVGSSS
jgi:hypothetical protein